MNFFSKSGVSTLVLYDDDLADPAVLKGKLEKMHGVLLETVEVSVASDTLVPTALAIVLSFLETHRQSGKKIRLAVPSEMQETLQPMGLDLFLPVVRKI